MYHKPKSTFIKAEEWAKVIDDKVITLNKIENNQYGEVIRTVEALKKLSQIADMIRKEKRVVLIKLHLHLEKQFC